MNTNDNSWQTPELLAWGRDEANRRDEDNLWLATSGERFAARRSRERAAGIARWQARALVRLARAQGERAA